MTPRPILPRYRYRINAPLSKNQNRVIPSHVPSEGVDAKTGEVKRVDKSHQERCGRKGGLKATEGYNEAGVKGYLEIKAIALLSSTN